MAGEYTAPTVRVMAIGPDLITGQDMVINPDINTGGNMVMGAATATVMLVAIIEATIVGITAVKMIAVTVMVMVAKSQRHNYGGYRGGYGRDYPG